MPTPLNEALAEAGPHTPESLAARLPHFPVEAIREALEALANQGVLAREVGEGGITAYRYVAPERYVQHTWDVVKDPGKRPGVKPR
jgi:hypothetical protein